MIRRNLARIRNTVGDFHRRSLCEWHETTHMARVYRDLLIGRSSPDQVEKAHAQAGDVVRMLIIGSTQIIPLPVVPTLLLLIILKSGKAIGVRVVPSNWHRP